MPDADSQAFPVFLSSYLVSFAAGLCLNAVSSDLSSIINGHIYNLKAVAVHTANHNRRSTLVIKFVNRLVDTDNH